MGSQPPLRQRCDPPWVTPKPFSLQMKIYFLSTSHPAFLAKMVLILLVPLLSFIARTHVKEDARLSSSCSTAGSDLLFIFGNFEFQNHISTFCLTLCLIFYASCDFVGTTFSVIISSFPQTTSMWAPRQKRWCFLDSLIFLSVYIQHFTGHPS